MESKKKQLKLKKLTVAKLSSEELVDLQGGTTTGICKWAGIYILNKMVDYSIEKCTEHLGNYTTGCPPYSQQGNCTMNYLC